MKCPFCNLSCPGIGRMAAHVWSKHRWQDVAGRKIVIAYSGCGSAYRFSQFACWCGVDVGGEYGVNFGAKKRVTFHDHLKDRGGIHAHLLEIGLEILP